MTIRSISTIDVVLASRATWRSDILKQLGIKHRQIEHRYDEPRFASGSLEKFIESIAVEKAKSLELECAGSMIVAADQLISLENTVLYKPGTPERAVEQLQLLNGKEHRLICAVAVLFNGKLKSSVAMAELTMRDLQQQEIKKYVDIDKPWDCAGSYKIESLGASLFEHIKVDDPTTIVGLPSNKLLDILRQFGFSNLL